MVESGQDARQDKPQKPPPWPKAWQAAIDKLHAEGWPAAEVSAAAREALEQAGTNAAEFATQGVYSTLRARLEQRAKARGPKPRTAAPVVVQHAPPAASGCVEKIIAQIVKLKPAEPQVDDLAEGERMVAHTGRPRTPWRDFRDAGLVPRQLFHRNGWDLLSLVFRSWDSGWGKRDRQPPGTGYRPLMTSRVARMTSHTARRWAVDFIRWGFIEELPDRAPGGHRLLRPAWPLKPDPSAYLLECVERMRRMRSERKSVRPLSAHCPPGVRAVSAPPPGQRFRPSPYGGADCRFENPPFLPDI